MTFFSKSLPVLESQGSLAFVRSVSSSLIGNCCRAN